MAEAEYFGVVTSIGDLAPIPDVFLGPGTLSEKQVPSGYELETEFGDQRSVAFLLDQDPDTRDSLEFLRAMRELSAPVYLEVAAGWRVTKVEPVVSGIPVESDEDKYGDVRVFRLDTSSRWFSLRRAYVPTDFSAYRKIVKDAEHSQKDVVLVTVDSDGISVKKIAASSVARPVLRTVPAPTYTESAIDRLTTAQASACWTAVISEACFAAGAGCIPFSLIEDGCWVRAHAVARSLRALGFTPGKVWLKGNLSTATTFHRGCRFGWAWHVAVFVRPETGSLRDDFLVFEPSTAPSGYLRMADWIASLGGASTVVLTSDEAYLDVVNGAGVGGRTARVSTRDVALTEMDDELVFYRAMLKKKNPQPPYACP